MKGNDIFSFFFLPPVSLNCKVDYPRKHVLWFLSMFSFYAQNYDNARCGVYFLLCPTGSQEIFDNWKRYTPPRTHTHTHITGKNSSAVLWGSWSFEIFPPSDIMSDPNLRISDVREDWFDSQPLRYYSINALVLLETIRARWLLSPVWRRRCAVTSGGTGASSDHMVSQHAMFQTEPRGCAPGLKQARERGSTQSLAKCNSLLISLLTAHTVSLRMLELGYKECQKKMSR